MNKYFIGLCGVGLLFMSSHYYGSTTAPVVIVGGIIKAKHINDTEQKKYKRKDCPVCKGKGWYMSGDDIKKIDCTYCEPDTQDERTIPAPSAPSKNCPNGKCLIQTTPRK